MDILNEENEVVEHPLFFSSFFFNKYHIYLKFLVSLTLIWKLLIGNESSEIVWQCVFVLVQRSM